MCRALDQGSKRVWLPTLPMTTSADANVVTGSEARRCALRTQAMTGTDAAHR